MRIERGIVGIGNGKRFAVEYPGDARARIDHDRIGRNHISSSQVEIGWQWLIGDVITKCAACPPIGLPKENSFSVRVAPPDAVLPDAFSMT